MSKLTPLPTARVLKALHRAGWCPRKLPGKRHYVLVNAERPGIVSVPRHRTLRKGTLAKIIKQAGLTPKEFQELYK